MKTIDFDKKFDEGHEIFDHLDISKAKRLNQEPRRVNVDFPEWMIIALDMQAKRLCVSRQAIIKIWLAERLKIENNLVTN